jgi:hypothetical protein
MLRNSGLQLWAAGGGSFDNRSPEFKDEITLSHPGSPDVIAISLWESKANAEAYNSNTDPEVLRKS